MKTGIMPWPRAAKLSVGKLIGWPLVYHLAKPRAVTIMPSVAMKGGIVVAARGQTAQAGMGTMYELDAIAMAVIGGTSLTGGRGSIIGTSIGMVIFGVIISGFTFLRLDAYYQEMIKGVIIVVAVIVDTQRQQKRGKKS